MRKTLLLPAFLLILAAIGSAIYFAYFKEPAPSTDNRPLKIVSPKEGETWLSGNEYSIKWEPEGQWDPGNVNLAIVKKGDPAFRFNLCQKESPYDCSLKNSGEFVWQVPADDGRNPWNVTEWYQIALETGTGAKATSAEFHILTIDPNKPSESEPFQKSDRYGFFGTATLKGYLDIRRIECEPGGMCEKTRDYAYFAIEGTDNSLIYDWLREYDGNTYVQRNMLGLGCYEPAQNRIYSVNESDTGLVDNIISGDSLARLLAASKSNPVRIKITKPIYTGGRGAPDCYAHIRNIQVLE